MPRLQKGFRQPVAGILPLERASEAFQKLFSVSSETASTAAGWAAGKASERPPISSMG